MKIKVGSRRSPLARAQVEEVLVAIRSFYPQIAFDVELADSTGDLDKKTSLRSLGKTDFFTKEIDEMVLQGKCRIGIHSAKDLPDPIPKGLCIVAITLGLTSSDSLVLRMTQDFKALKKGAVIATSALRREEAVQALCPDQQFSFIDLRGTIGERLSLLDKGVADGVVVAECALIRLGLTHLNRVKLPGDTTPLQGQLAILAREGDQEMIALFKDLDTRVYTYTQAT